MYERRVLRGVGPYTDLDMCELPDGGKGFELEDGWLIEVSGGARHNFVLQRLGRFLDVAAGDAAVHICIGGGWAVRTRSGIRRPDIVVVARDVARVAIVENPPRLIPAADVLLAVEVVAHGTDSERTDRVRKVR